MQPAIKSLLFIFILSFHAIGFAQSATEPDSTATGYLMVETEVDSFYVVLDNDFENALHVSSKDTLPVEAGEYRLRLVKKYHRDLTTTISIPADSLKIIRTSLLSFRSFNQFKYFSSYPRIFWGAPAVIQTDPDARLFIDGEFIGQGIARIDTLGYVTVRSELPNGASVTKDIYFEEPSRGKRFSVKKLYNRPQQKKTRLLSLLPGGSQLYQREHIKGYALMGAILVTSGIAVKYHLDFKDEYQQFKHTRTEYKSAQKPEQAFYLGNLAEKQLNAANTTADRRDLFLYGAIGLYLYNLVDAFLKPPNGYRRTVQIDPYVDFDRSYKRKMGFSVRARINF